MLNLEFHDNAWEDYLFWSHNDKRISKRINALIKEMRRTPMEGTGNPERLKHNLSGLWSRRINQEHRLVYRFTDSALIIISCRYHY